MRLTPKHPSRWPQGPRWRDARSTNGGTGGWPLHITRAVLLVYTAELCMFPGLPASPALAAAGVVLEVDDLSGCFPALWCFSQPSKWDRRPGEAKSWPVPLFCKQTSRRVRKRAGNNTQLHTIHSYIQSTAKHNLQIHTKSSSSHAQIKIVSMAVEYTPRITYAMEYPTMPVMTSGRYTESI
jgi:hypothetical protein